MSLKFFRLALQLSKKTKKTTKKQTNKQQQQQQQTVRRKKKFYFINVLFFSPENSQTLNVLLIKPKRMPRVETVAQSLMCSIFQLSRQISTMKTSRRFSTKRFSHFGSRYLYFLFSLWWGSSNTLTVLQVKSSSEP